MTTYRAVFVTCPTCKRRWEGTWAAAERERQCIWCGAEFTVAAAAAAQRRRDDDDKV